MAASAKAEVTKHAEKRIRQRLGINKKSTEKAADKALQFGISHAEVKGKLSRHLDGIFLLNYNPTNMRVYSHSIYLFRDSRLITVLPLPNRFWAYADKLQKQKAEKIKQDKQESNDGECQEDIEFLD